MRKLTLTIAIILGMCLGAMAQNNKGGLFAKGPTSIYDEDYYNERNFGLLSLPGSHGEAYDQPSSPLGGGVLLLIGLGAAYASMKKNQNRKD